MWCKSFTEPSEKIEDKVTKFLDFMEEEDGTPDIISITQSSVIEDGTIFVTVIIVGR